MPQHLLRILATLAVVLISLLALFEWPFSAPAPPQLATAAVDNSATEPQHTNFRLQHVYHHNTESNMQQMRLDVAHQRPGTFDTQTDMLGFHAQAALAKDKVRRAPVDHEFRIKRKQHTIRALANRDPDFVEGYLNYASANGRKAVAGMALEWHDRATSAPDVTDVDSVVQLAIMASNAYCEEPFEGDWQNVTQPFNKTDTVGIGWMSDGVRGHVFSDETNSTIVIAIKGTSAAIFDSGGDTTTNDKTNDNLLFSCCCARISYMWNTVCDCYTGDAYTCNQDCLEFELYSQDRYYKAILNVYRDVRSLYPNADVWVAGHSLGGALSSFLARTYGLPAVTFQAVPELLATKRLHLPMPPGAPPLEDHVWHFGHTADPIYMGVCNGASSSCWIGGYAMETQCHSGYRCVYDTVTDLGWHVSLVNHRIHTVIDFVLMGYNETAKCVIPSTCQDCFNWKFVSRDGEVIAPPPNPTVTSEPPAKTSESPQKCVRRNWYGKCLEWGEDADPKTSTSTTTKAAHKSTPTTTQPVTTALPGECIRRSWFGRCLEYSNTTTQS